MSTQQTLARRVERITPPIKKVYLTNWGDGFTYKDKQYKTIEELLKQHPELKDCEIETSCVVWE